MIQRKCLPRPTSDHLCDGTHTLKSDLISFKIVMMEFFRQTTQGHLQHPVKHEHWVEEAVPEHVTVNPHT
jgi:hypothetical protein